MKLLLFLAAFLIGFSAFAQEGIVPDFICLHNGKLTLPFLKQSPGEMQNVKSASICETHIYTSEGIERTDTSVIYKADYSPNGDLISREGISYGEFKGFQRLLFNKEGAILSKEFDFAGMRGCGNYHWLEYGHRHYAYDYRNGLLHQITIGDSSFINYAYDKEGNRIAVSNRYYLHDSGKVILAKGSFRNEYRYDRTNRLVQEYRLYDSEEPGTVEVADFPDNMERILLRQFPDLKNKYLVDEFGITEDSLYVDKAELPEAFVAHIDRRDSIDETLIEQYKKIAGAFTGYQYNEKGLLIRRTTFHDDDLDSLETFEYDQQERLVKWVTTRDYFDQSNWDKGTEIVWSFSYSKDNRVSACEHRQFARKYQSYPSRDAIKGPLELNETRSYKFDFEGSGRLITIHQKATLYGNNDERHYFVTYAFFK